MIVEFDEAFEKSLRPIQDPNVFRKLKRIIIQIENSPSLATSESIQGLVAQGRTVTETLEIARDVAKKILEAHYKSTQ